MGIDGADVGAEDLLMEHVERYASGEVCARGPADELGRRHGVWIVYDERGQVVARVRFEHGRAIGRRP